MRNKKHIKPLKCGLLFSRSLIQSKDLQAEISAEASHQLGSDIHDAITFQELSIGLHVQFKTHWNPARDVFTIGKGNGNDTPDIDRDMICMLTTETKTRALNHRLNSPFYEGKRVLEWDSVKKLVRLGIRIVVRHAAFLEGDVFRVWVVGDTQWLPKPFMRKHVRLGKGEKSYVVVSLSENEI